MRRLNFRIELDVIPAATPGVGRAAQQIVHFVYTAFHLPELINRHIDIRMLFAMRIEVYYDENDVIARSRHLAVKQNGVILRVVESQIRVKLKRTVLFSDFVYSRDPILD